MDERRTLRDTRDLRLLSEIERDPDATQVGLAEKLGVAVGTVNWHLKRMVAKGHVKVKRAERRKLRYIVTPSGLALRARLTVRYVEASMRLYRELREAARREIGRARKAGFKVLQVHGDGDVADVCRLTCLEMGVGIVEEAAPGEHGVLQIDGNQVRFLSPGTRGPA